MPDKPMRVAVIGSTSQGDYGHGLDTAFLDLKEASVVAVADDHPAGLKKAAVRLQVDRTYADYRKMLERERPDIVCIAPRWITERDAMVEAVTSIGSHIYCEKPLAAELEVVDRIVKACRSARVKLAMAHQWRAMPPVQKAITDIKSGRYGKLLRMRARPKDDRRGGGEELLLHGTHLLDMMIAFAGQPKWVSGHVTVGGREATKSDVREASEPLGPIAGDSISALFGFDNGVRGYFETTANLSIRGRSPFDNLYGLFLECEKAALMLRQPGDVFVYPAPIVLPDLDKLKWEKMWIEDWHFTPEHKPRPLRREWLRIGNKTLAKNLIASIRNDREPLSGLAHAAAITEIVQGVYASHLDDGRRLMIPLSQRRHPLKRQA